MYGDLQHITDDELLNYVMLILTTPDPFTGHISGQIDVFHMTELEQIEAEFMRRGTLCGEEYTA